MNRLAAYGAVESAARTIEETHGKEESAAAIREYERGKRVKAREQ